MDDQSLTFGQEAVGLTFNPSGDERVNKAKQLIDDAIDLLEEVHLEACSQGQPSWIRNVFKTNAFNAFNALITAQMALIKYITWKK